MSFFPSTLTAAPFTAFHADGSLNLDRIADQAAVLRETGVRGAFVCGTTGEGASLSTRERQAVAERWKAVASDLQLIVHAGHSSLAEARELVAHAAAIGANAVAITAPYYFRPSTITDLVTFFREVAAAAPKLPIYYYDIPSITGVTLNAAELLRRAAEVVPNLAGVKFSNPDLLTLQECVNLHDQRFEVLFGCDEFLLAAVSLGATGAVGSTYCYAAPVYHRLLQAVQRGDLATARHEQYQSALLVRPLIEFGGLRAGKAIMKMIGVDCGPVRTPLRPMKLDEELAFYERLKDLNIFARPLRKPS
jgi:N-acetylneuraminate lyase